jgi:hypothetical protein
LYALEPYKGYRPASSATIWQAITLISCVGIGNTTQLTK